MHNPCIARCCIFTVHNLSAMCSKVEAASIYVDQKAGSSLRYQCRLGCFASKWHNFYSTLTLGAL